MGSNYYRIICLECGGTGETGGDSRWLTPFFLPERCPHCDAWKSRHEWSLEAAGWRETYGRWVTSPTAPPFIWWKPSTWRPEKIWIDRDEERRAARLAPEGAP